MKEKHRQLLIGDISMRGMALYTMACRHLPAFIDKKWCLLVAFSQIISMTLTPFLLHLSRPRFSLQSNDHSILSPQ